MGSDLHRPLGQDRKSRSGRRPFGGLLRRVPFVLFAVVAIGFSGYVALSPLPLGDGLSPPTQTSANSAQPAAETAPAATRDPAASLARARPNSGANVVRQTLPDGNVVTTYTPRARDGAGPAFIDTPRIGQDPRTAAIPNDALVEQSPDGPLPVIASDGLTPMEQYARPWSGARGTRLAIVIGGLGLSQTGTQNAVKRLPPEVTLAFAATGNSLQRWVQDARRGGHEVLLQLPFEPFDYPANNPGPATLLTTDTPDQTLVKLHQSMGKFTNYTGVMNYLGGKFLTDADALEPVMRDITDRGMLFLDDGSSAASLTGQIGKGLGTPQLFADVQIDDQIDTESILKRLDEAERIARRNGQAVAVGFAFDETIEAVASWCRDAQKRGIEIVGPTALALENQP
ncbi:divergent polysaccharide deacetylase family protein [Rhizobium halophytocola]|uniref:Polysaccharide deacetylase 2 family uncharacterized protein YibQ n=1 Tax=Rhizobium halophytocola TaxID=735519 RepID=A0ABS4E245_9HYPH|nr:polysaccharide deacetylase 2 family uncharacterized protein YibQ [Rhizobium halophytocola]